MDAPARTYFRSLVISLAISLTIFDLTQGFTLRSQISQDLVAEESSHLEVQNDIQRPNDTKKDEPIIPIQDTTPAATSTIINTEATKDITEHTSVDNTPTDVTELSTAEVITTAASAAVSVRWMELSQTTTAPAVEKNDEIKPSNDTISTNTEKVSRISEELDNTILATSTEQAPNTEKTTTESAEQTTGAQLQTATAKEENDITTTDTITNNESTTAEVTTESQSTETSIPVTTFKLTSAWKKYSSISRNHVDTIEKEDVPPRAKLVDSINSHTTESRITLEKAFELSPGIESLQKLKAIYAMGSNAMPTARALETANVVQTETEAIPSSTTDKILNDNETTVAGNQTEMVSKRAGFLNHTRMNSTEPPTVQKSYTRRRDMGSDGGTDEMYFQGDNERRKSHIRLAEDALKEELLKESMMKDRKVNSIRYRLPSAVKEKEQPQHTPLDVITLSSTESLSVVTTEQTEQKTADELSVKPINPEKKNTNIYAVNPNYKPLKKIDVQPPKPFTRDPDDNSWRNESLNSLGIVFKAKNASKAFTEVLKNKTETVMNSLPEVNRTVEKYELRDRLEKIAEKRKSKKKKVDKFGNTEYADYEENSNSGDFLTSKETPPTSSSLPTTTEDTSSKTTTTPVPVASLITNARPQVLSTDKPKKLFQDYYDTTDDDDYATFPNVDIMKATVRPRVQWPVTQRILEQTTPKQHLPERKPTVQYFPPLRKPSPDVSVNEYDDDFKKKITLYKLAQSMETAKLPSVRDKNYPTESNHRTSTYNSNENRIRQPVQHVHYTPVTGYLTQPPKPPSGASFEDPDAFIIRHYKDLINAAIKDNDYDRNAFLYTEAPVTGVTANDAGKMAVKSEEYDYEQRKEVLDTFVNNFNQNHEQFKVDFPVLFNSSIVHSHGQEGGKVLASSSATFKRLYKDDTATKANGFLFSSKPYDPGCANITVELSPAYELHYYVPGQEEREESSGAVAPLDSSRSGGGVPPYGYRL